MEPRLRAGVLGALIGDALGIPFEFRSPERVRSALRDDLSCEEGFQRAHQGTPAWTYSDDGAQILALAESLMDANGLSLTDLGGKLLDWLNAGRYAVDGRVFDFGRQTYEALARLYKGESPETCGVDHESANGNGSLMRVLPVALWCRGTDTELVNMAMRSSIPTHPHLRSQICCAFYCLVARRLLEERYTTWQTIYLELRDLLKGNAAAVEELDNMTEPSLVYRPPPGPGYVVDSLWVAIRALEQPSYQDAIHWVISLGYDTDTNACLAGGLAGLKWGMSGIPGAWVSSLRGRETWLPILERLEREVQLPAAKGVATKRVLVRAMSHGQLFSYVPGRKDVAVIFIDDPQNAVPSRARRFTKFHAFHFQDIDDRHLTWMDRAREYINQHPRSARFPELSDIHGILKSAQVVMADPETAEIVVACEYGRSRSVAAAIALDSYFHNMTAVLSNKQNKGNPRMARLFTSEYLRTHAVTADSSPITRKVDDRY